MGDASLAFREEIRFREMLEAYLRTRLGTTPPTTLVAAAADIARQAERVSSAMRPIALQNELPASITIRLPTLLPLHDPDRDVQILLATLDHCSINSSALLLDRSRDTIRGVTALARTSVEREAKRLLGPHFHPPPRNPKRSKQQIIEDF